MKRHYLTTLLLLFIFVSCDKRTDYKTVSDGIISVEAFTTVKPDVQSSNPDISTIKVKKGFDSKEILTYDSHGINNVDIKIDSRQIFISGADLQTAGLLEHVKPSVTDVFGYKIVIITDTLN